MRRFGPRSLTKLCVLGAALGLAGTAMGETTWEKSFANAIRKASAAKKPIFVDFAAEWCGPCKMLEKNVFSDGRVQKLFGNAICLHIDVDQNQADAARFGVSSIPRLLLLTPDGKKVLWDTMGYRDADSFVQELSEAMKVKVPIAGVKGALTLPSALTNVESALEGGTFAQFKLKDPAAAAKGLRLMVQQLGAFKEADFKSTAELLQKAGRDAAPALLEGMGDKTLAVRVGANKVLLAILGKDAAKNLAFDPWAPLAVREKQLALWKKSITG